MSSEANLGKDGAFQPVAEKQAQKLPGTEEAMQPASESVMQEGEDGFREYRGAGKLEGKSALITGGDSGIGRSVAVLYAKEGADVSIVYLPEEQRDAEETRRMVEKEGRQCQLSPGDLRSYDFCRQIVDSHMSQFGKLDILVNNASKQEYCKDFADIDLGVVEDTFRTNVFSMFAVTKYAVPHLKKGASIINTTSVVAFRGTGNMVDYAATKGAIKSFTHALQKQLLPKGIRVNAVAPGPVHTPLQPASRPAEEMEGFGEKSQLGRPGQPSEIAPSYVLLASADGALYCGQVLQPYPLGD